MKRPFKKFNVISNWLMHILVEILILIYLICNDLSAVNYYSACDVCAYQCLLATKYFMSLTPRNVELISFALG